MKRSYFIHDTETTGTEGDDRIIETAHLLVSEGNLVDHTEELCNPGVKIKPEAAMTHGYRNSDIKGKPDFSKTKSCKIILEATIEENTFYVAHNAPFDLGMLEKEGISFNKDRVIDTLKVAQHLYNNNEEVKMMKLQYFRFLFEDYFEEKEKEYMKKVGVDYIRPHTALSDILVLWIFLEKLKEDFNVSDEDMVRLSQSPVLLQKLNVGKVFPKGTLFKDIVGCEYKTAYGKLQKGYEYLDWFVREEQENRSVMDSNFEYSVKYFIAQGILNGTVFCTVNFHHYLNYGILFFLTKEEIKEAIRKQGKGKTDEEFQLFYKNLCGQYVKRTTDDISKAEENIEELTDLELEKFKKNKFMLNYFINYRQNIL